MARQVSWPTTRASPHPIKILLAKSDKACPRNFPGSSPRNLASNKTLKIPRLWSQPASQVSFTLILRNSLSHPGPNNTIRSNRLPKFCQAINLYNSQCKIDLLSNSSRRWPRRMAACSLRSSPASRTTARTITTTTAITPAPQSSRGWPST